MNLIIKALPPPRSLEVWTGAMYSESTVPKTYLRPANIWTLLFYCYISRDAASETKKRLGLCGHGARWPGCAFQREVVQRNILFYY